MQARHLLTQISNKLLPLLYNGSVSSLGMGVYSLASVSIGKYIHSENIISTDLMAAEVLGGIGGAITGATASAIFVKNFRENYSFTKKFLPGLYFVLPAISEFVSYGLAHVNTFKFCSSYPYDNTCVNTTELGKDILLGMTVLTGGELLLYWIGTMIVEEYRRRHEIANATQQEQQHSRGPTLQERLESINFQGNIPQDFIDVFTLDVMDQPCILECGHNVDKKSLGGVQSHGSCPTCRSDIANYDFDKPIPNVYLRGHIIKFVEENERNYRPDHVVIDIKEEEEEVEEKEQKENSTSFTSRSHSFFSSISNVVSEQTKNLFRYKP